MKESLPDDLSSLSPQRPLYPLPKQHRFNKRWMVAKSTNLGVTAKINNQLTEIFYHKILLQVKALYAPLGITCYEKDSREDNTENSFTMHTFLCSSFYWELECPLCYFYKVNYDFHNCPFQAEIQQLIERYYADNLPAAHRFLIQPNCATYFRRVQMVQEPQHFYLIK